jgi:hypothetical protein
MTRQEKILLLHRLSTGEITMSEFLRLAGDDQTWLSLDGETCKCIQTGEVKTRDEMIAHMQEQGGFINVTLNI